MNVNSDNMGLDVDTSRAEAVPPPFVQELAILRDRCDPQRLILGWGRRRQAAVEGLRNHFLQNGIGCFIFWATSEFIFPDDTLAMLLISDRLSIADSEIEMTAIRAQGAGGQNVNKVASAVHLRFDIRGSSLPEAYKSRLLCSRDQRITKSGVIVIKAQEYRTFEKNRDAARLRLAQLIRSAMKPVKKRRPTRPSRSAAQRRVDRKTRRGKLKALRRNVTND